MPIYEYQCDQCHAVSEVLQKMSDPAPESCPQCGGGPMQKIMSQSSFVLKGGGWYTDAYASKKNDDKGTKDSKPAEASSASSDKSAKTSEKPATQAKDTPTKKAPKKDS